MIFTSIPARAKLILQKVLFFTLIMPFILFSAANAQNNKGTVTGKVTTADNQPVENATVSIKGFVAKTSTDQSGNFSISATAGNQELIISIVGYSKKTIKINVIAGSTTSVNNIIISGSNDMNQVDIAGKTTGKALKQQAFNVNILDTKVLYNSSADLNQALNRTSGVRVREDGGVGSNFTFSLNGFSGRQVKFFLDGIPMDNFGSSLTLNNFPVNMAERVEIYKGVLPISLGADALGGAVNIVTRSNPNYMDVSYGYGSFNTYKASFNSAYTNAKTGFTVRANAFYNYSDNNYKVDVQPLNLSTGVKGPLQEIERFHDGYESGTIQLEAGVSGKKYADKLLFGVIASGNEKDIQTGVTMEQVFGARTTRSSSIIPTVKYKKTDLFVKGLDLSLYSAYNMSRNRFIDTTRLGFNWLQETISDGRTAEYSRTQLLNKDKEGLVTANLAYKLNDHHAVSYNYVMNDFRRKSSDVENPDNVTYQYPQKLNKQIMGLAWQANYTNFTATVFSKLYLLDVNSFEQVSNGTGVSTYQASSQNESNVGYGAAAAYFILPELQAKASYEHTYRLPEAVELLGDGLYTRRNSTLKPESSDNINLGALYSIALNQDNKIGIEANYIYRNSKDYIRLDQSQTQPVDRQYINIGDVLTNGVEGEIKYSWKNKLLLNVNMTYQNIIDKEEYISTTNFGGTTASPNQGFNHRVTNTPYLFGNADAGYVFNKTGGDKNSLSVNYSLNFVEKYNLTLSHLGFDNKDIIPSQFAHNLMANYAVNDGKYNISLECRNLTDANLFDNYMLQKPGRSFFVKLRYFISK